MPTLVRMSEATGLALHAATYLATQPGRHVPVTELTRACRASGDHMTKVCQRLVRAKLFKGRRGQGGGLSLAKPAASIRLAAIYQLFEGPLSGPDCLLRRSVCEGQKAGQCVFSQDLRPIHAQIKRYLRSTTLAAVAARCRHPHAPRKPS